MRQCDNTRGYTAAGESVVYRASLCDIDRVCKNHQEQKDDASSETSFLSLSENDNNGNFIESSSQGTSTAPAGQGPVQQVWSLTQFYSVDFPQPRIGGRKCVFNKRTIKVCVSC